MEDITEESVACGIQHACLLIELWSVPSPTTFEMDIIRHQIIYIQNRKILLLSILEPENYGCPQHE
jgi:hypothetical protein